MDKPTYEKFKRYCISKNYGTDEYIKSLYDYLDERKWKKANGGEPVNWMILTDANFGVFNAKGKFSRAIRENWLKSRKISTQLSHFLIMA